VIGGHAFSLLLPVTLGIIALGVWIVMLFMFKPGAQLRLGEEFIVLKLTNAQILRVERRSDELIVHLDRKIAGALEVLAA
jgi:hypothetical protein